MTAIALEIFRGDDEVLDISFKQADGITALNITGATGIWFTAKSSSLDTDAQALIQKTLGAGVTIVSAAAGTATVTINAADTVAIEPSTLVWDAQIRDAAGKVRTAASGTLKVIADVTRALA